MDLLFKYYSPLAESSDIQNSSQKKENKRNSFKTTMGFKFDNIINFDELECQNFNLNGNYKRIYYYKDDDDTESMTNPNESFDLKNFSFIDIDDEKNSKENNIESINKLSNNIKKDIIAKENKKKKKNENNKNVKKSNKGNSSNTVLSYNHTDKKIASDIKDENSNSKNEIENMSINNSVRIINDSKLNNKSKVTLSQKNNINSISNINKDKNNINNVKNKPTNLKLINKTEKKVNHYRSMDKLNSIIEDYYKSKVKRNEKNSNNNNNNNNNVLYTIKVNNNDTNNNNNLNNNNIKSISNNINIINNENKINETNINDNIRINKNLIEEDFNNSSINVGPGLVRVTYSSSCDNKKIRSSSAFKGTKVTVFQHFNRKHTVNNYYRDN